MSETETAGHRWTSEEVLAMCARVEELGSELQEVTAEIARQVQALSEELTKHDGPAAAR